MGTERTGGTIAYRFHARDAHLVLAPERTGRSPSRYTLTVRLLDPHVGPTSTMTETAFSATAASTSSYAPRHGPRAHSG
jgi:hypothetical protein